MPKPRIKTLKPELLREIRWTIDQVQKMPRGNLRDDDRRPDKAPDDCVILTPPGGIPGRRRKKIFAVWCPVYRLLELTPATQGGPKKLVKIKDGTGAAYKLPIYNVYCEAVPGDQFVPTGLLKDGTRYVLGWEECSESFSSSSSSSESSSSSSSESSSGSSSESDSGSASQSSSDSQSASESANLPTGNCESVPTCTWVGRVFESGYKYWAAHGDLTMPECRGIDPFSNIGCWCDEPAQLPDYDYQVAYTACNQAD